MSAAYECTAPCDTATCVKAFVAFEYKQMILSRRVGTNRDFGETLLRSLRVLARCVLTDGHENRRRQRNRFGERSGARGLRVTITSPLAALQLCFFRCSWEPLARPDESPLNGSMQARF